MADLLTYGLGPEWVPGPDGVPFRRAARVILVDSADRVLLVRGHDSAQVERTWWFTVGGGLDAREDERTGAVRELAEETGIVLEPGELVGPVLTRSAVFDFARITCRQDEDFFFARIDRAEVTHTGWTELERNVLDELRWWSIAELEEATGAGVVVYPRSLPTVVQGLLEGWDGTVAHLDESSL